MKWRKMEIKSIPRKSIKNFKISDYSCGYCFSSIPIGITGMITLKPCTFQLCFLVCYIEINACFFLDWIMIHLPLLLLIVLLPPILLASLNCNDGDCVVNRLMIVNMLVIDSDPLIDFPYVPICPLIMHPH